MPQVTSMDCPVQSRQSHTGRALTTSDTVTFMGGFGGSTTFNPHDTRNTIEIAMSRKGSEGAHGELCRQRAGVGGSDRVRRRHAELVARVATQTRELRTRAHTHTRRWHLGRLRGQHSQRRRQGRDRQTRALVPVTVWVIGLLHVCVPPEPGSHEQDAATGGFSADSPRCRHD